MTRKYSFTHHALPKLFLILFFIVYWIYFAPLAKNLHGIKFFIASLSCKKKMVLWQCECFITKCCYWPVLHYCLLLFLQKCDYFTVFYTASWWNYKTIQNFRWRILMITKRRERGRRHEYLICIHKNSMKLRILKVWPNYYLYEMSSKFFIHVWKKNNTCLNFVTYL